jgi:hypothetical protein
MSINTELKVFSRHFAINLKDNSMLTVEGD